MSAIAIIPAKGRSARIPRKNIRMFHGKPIIAYSIAAALESGLFKGVFVSTDDDEIGAVSLQYGAQVVRRKKELCADAVGPLDVARFHVDAEHMPGVPYVCVIYATAPMLRGEDLWSAYAMMRAKYSGYVLSVYGADDEPLTDAAQFVWCGAGALTARLPLAGMDTSLFPISPDRVCDINTEEDWQRAERMYTELHRQAA